MGYSPLMWGKEAWRFIHFVALSYPETPTEKQKKIYYDFFASLQDVLPCPTCANNFKKKMDEKPPNMENRKTLFRWTVDIHNSVNVENGKEVMSYEDAEKELFSNKYEPYVKGVFASAFAITALLITIKYIVKTND